MEIAKIKLLQLCQHGDLLERYGASLRILGERELVRPDVLEVMDMAVDMTKNNDRYASNCRCDEVFRGADSRGGVVRS